MAKFHGRPRYSAAVVAKWNPIPAFAYPFTPTTQFSHTCEKDKKLIEESAELQRAIDGCETIEKWERSPTGV
jgi:hypothetical protein